MMILSELSEESKLRNIPLVGAFYKGPISGWKQVMPNFGIAKNTFNDLGHVWTSNTIWTFDYPFADVT